MAAGTGKPLYQRRARSYAHRMGRLTLITAETVVVVLAGIRALGPLRVGRLSSAAVAASALGATVAHVLTSVSGRRLSTGTSEVTGLTTILSR